MWIGEKHYSNMKRALTFLAAAALVVACASPEKMARMAENVKVTCDPEVLEVVGGSIDPVVTVTYPKDYFNPNVVMEVTPVIVYQGGEAAGKVIKYQGENVKQNYKAIAKDGKKVTERLHFDYVKGMEKSRLELRAKVLSGKKSINLPTRKVADGANTTYMLVKRSGNVSFKPDNYQDVIIDTKEGQIKYQVNSSEVRGSELKGTSVKEFLAALEEAAANERATVTSTEIVAYASPEGKESHNNELSGNRGKSASKAWDQITRNTDTVEPTVKSVGEDWEGFQELVAQSNLEDKDLILRVLSMYSDPAVRENEIRNMSQVFTQLKGEVLPQLRRARLIANVKIQNYTNEELIDLLKNNEDVLDEEALLRAASVVKDADQKEDIYRKAIEKFSSDRAMFNLATLYLAQGKTEKAAAGFAELDEKDPDVLNAEGVVALRNNNLEKAADLFRKAGTDDAKKNLGIVHILSGQYDEAANELASVSGCCHNTVLAFILTDQLDKAMSSAHCGDPKVWYLKAIIAARKGNAAQVKTFLERAYANPALKERAATDIEFSGYDI